jgi:hypothetical protein
MVLQVVIMSIAFRMIIISLDLYEFIRNSKVIFYTVRHLFDDLMILVFGFDGI